MALFSLSISFLILRLCSGAQQRMNRACNRALVEPLHDAIKALLRLLRLYDGTAACGATEGLLLSMRSHRRPSPQSLEIRLEGLLLRASRYEGISRPERREVQRIHTHTHTRTHTRTHAHARTHAHTHNTYYILSFSNLKHGS
jgi:hypothetical protein